MSFRTQRKSTLYPAVAPYRDEVAALRETLTEICEPETDEDLRGFAKLVSRNGKIISIVASLDDGHYVKQDIASLNASMCKEDEAL